MITNEIVDPYKVDVLASYFRKQRYRFAYTLQTPTTMDLAKTHAQLGGAIPAIFLTDHQTNGVGREGRTWLDKSGASVLVTGLVRIAEAVTPTFTDLVALHTCQALRRVSGIQNLQIKYPNDLVIDGAKTAGLLTVNLYNEGRYYLATSVGLGINVHYQEKELAGYPTDYSATSLDLHAAKRNYRQALLIAVFAGLRFFPADALIFQSNKRVQQDQNNLWRACSAVLEREVQVISGKDVLIAGKVVDTEIGRGILVETPTGSNRWINQFDTKIKVGLVN